MKPIEITVHMNSYGEILVESWKLSAGSVKKRRRDGKREVNYERQQKLERLHTLYKFLMYDMQGNVNK